YPGALPFPHHGESGGFQGYLSGRYLRAGTLPAQSVSRLRPGQGFPGTGLAWLASAWCLGGGCRAQYDGRLRAVRHDGAGARRSAEGSPYPAYGDPVQRYELRRLCRGGAAGAADARRADDRRAVTYSAAVTSPDVPAAGRAAIPGISGPGY